MILLILYTSNILFNIESIVNFRRSSKISEIISSTIYNLTEFSNENIKEIDLLKEEILIHRENIKDNKTKIKHKKKYINTGPNNIIISVIIIIFIILSLFLLIGNNMVIV